jgi:NAD(P)-dependent dehydrogenase (short-subunit alcohol dehydrogenase family)
MGKLAGKTVFITGGSRGIGKAIALRCAQDGANIVIAAKTATPHPKLPGTIYTACEEVEKAGGKCMPCVVDIQHEDQVQKAVQEAVNKFGGIDILVNNASAISLKSTESTSMKSYDLMNNINARGTFLCSKLCIPYLKHGKNPHILNISPPLNLNPHWFENHVAYTMAKYGMSFCVLGMAGELKNDSIAVNALWPKTAIYTAAVHLFGDRSAFKDRCRRPEIMADAAYAILCKDSKRFTGNFCIDEEILKPEGVTDLTKYQYNPNVTLFPDIFLDDPSADLKAEMEISRSSSKTTSKLQLISTGNSELDKVFEGFHMLLSPEMVASVNGVFEFDFKDGGVFFLDLKNGSGDIGAGKPEVDPDVIFTLNADNFVKIARGNINLTAAFTEGKLNIDGNLGVAMKLETLFKQYKSKL